MRRLGGVLRVVLVMAAVAGAYVLGGLLGLLFPLAGDVVSLIWPPTGIAFAAVWLLGWHVLPAVALGASALNHLMGYDPAFVLVTGIANALPSAVATLALRRLGLPRGLFDGLRSVLLFFAVAVVGSTAISAGVGALALVGTGTIGDWPPLVAWLGWWAGDAMGVLVLAPIAVVLATRPLRTGRPREALALAAALAALLALAFLHPVGRDYLGPVTFLILLVTLWSSLRFGTPGAATCAFAVAAASVLGTSQGLGPFVRDGVNESFAHLHGYLFTLAATGLLLAGSVEALRREADGHRRAEARAHAASAAKSQFLATVSHELRTPLNAIIGFSEMLEMEIMGPLNPKQREYLRDIHGSARHLLELIGQMLDFARIEAGRLELAEEPVDLADLAADIVRLSRPAAERKGVRLELEPKGGPGPAAEAAGEAAGDAAGEGAVLRADARMLRQVLLNLVDNAVKFTPAGGRVAVRVGEPGPDGVELSVTDTGVGIAAEDRAKVLEPFGQVRGADTVGQGGTGLGLPIVKALVEAHGGALALSGAPGRGTRVSCRFPGDRLVAEAGAVVAAEAEAEAGAGRAPVDRRG
jgi:signal transduction histidine kinase